MGHSLPLLRAHASMSGQFHAGLPPTVQSGSGSTSRTRHMSTVARLTPSRSAISGMPTGSQFRTPETVSNVLTSDQECRDNHYMTKTAEPSTCTARTRGGMIAQEFHKDTSGRWFRWVTPHAHKPQRRRQFWTWEQIERRAFTEGWILWMSGGVLVDGLGPFTADCPSCGEHFSGREPFTVAPHSRPVRDPSEHTIRYGRT